MRSVAERLAVVLVAVADELLLDAAERLLGGAAVAYADRVGEDVDGDQETVAHRGRAEHVTVVREADGEGKADRGAKGLPGAVRAIVGAPYCLATAAALISSVFRPVREQQTTASTRSAVAASIICI